MKMLALALPLLALGAAAPAQTAEDIVRLEILPGWETDTGTRMVGLRLVLAPGWKTYWRAPGNSGMRRASKSALLTPGLRLSMSTQLSVRIAVP